MQIKRKSDDKVFDVYGVCRDVQTMVARGWSETITWFLIWDTVTATGQGDWCWVTGAQYVPYSNKEN